MSKYVISIGFIVLCLASSGCGANPEVQVAETSKDTVVYEEIIHINNCGGKGDSEQTTTREFATSVEFGAEASAGYQSVVQGTLSAKYSEYRNTSKSQRLVAPPETNMEFVLRWSYDVRAGNVQMGGKTGTYEVRIPISVNQISSQDLGCGVASWPPSEQTTPSQVLDNVTITPPLENSGIGGKNNGGGFAVVMPSYPDAQVTASMSGYSMMSTVDAPQAVSDYFVQNLPDQGWTLQSNDSLGDMYIQTWAKEGQTLSITIMPDDEGTTTIMMTLE